MFIIWINLNLMRVRKNTNLNNILSINLNTSVIK